MIAGQDKGPFFAEDSRLVDNDLAADNGPCQPYNDFEKAIKQSVNFG